jgi:hypothetical protein
MSNFICDKCGTECVDSPIGYVTGCKHYPADVQRLMDEEENYYAPLCRVSMQSTPLKTENRIQEQSQ